MLGSYQEQSSVADGISGMQVHLCKIRPHGVKKMEKSHVPPIRIVYAIKLEDIDSMWVNVSAQKYHVPFVYGADTKVVGGGLSSENH